MNTLLSILFFMAGMIGLAVSVIILCKKENFKQNLFLSICLFALSVSSIYSFYLSQGKAYEYPKTVIILKSLSFLIAPCAFLYIRNTVLRIEKMKIYDWLHFLPLAIHLVYTTINVSSPITSDFWLTNNLFFKIDFFSFNVILTLLWLFYAYTQNLMLLNIERKKDIPIYGNFKTINWLKTLSMMLLLLFTSILLQRISSLKFINLDLTNNILTSFILFLAGYVLVFRPSILFDIKDATEEYIPLDNDETDEDCAVRKLPLVSISQEKLEDYARVLNGVLISEEPFLKRGFVIRDLADLTGIPIHHLSHVINTQYNLHFQDFVNQQRIDYLKARINNKEWKNLSLEGLAWAVGFKSRTTFFRAFIKLTGQSPSEYLNSERKKKTHPYTATA